VPAVIHRTTHSIEFKCRVLDELIKYELEQIAFPQKMVSLSHQGISKKNISDWSRNRVKILKARTEFRGTARYIQSETRVWYVDFVYGVFVSRFRVFNFSVCFVSQGILKLRMKST